ncbi:MAG: o-succinylbenzoate synthase [Planctomycetota bacterium]
MKIYRFQIPLKKTLNLKGSLYRDREGILIEQNGRWAEASPIPGFSPESITDVIHALRENTAPTPAVKFALDSLNSDFGTKLSHPYNVLLAGSQSQILADAHAKGDSGCRAFKVKVGRESLDRDIALVRKVSSALPAGIRLRLDANQAWELKDAIYFVNSTSDLNIEYIEEPLKDNSKLEELFDETAIHYALDESLVGTDSFEGWPNVSALICKPTLIGGRTAIKKLASTGKPIVFSSAFESGVGIARIVELAAEFAPDIPAGLDTIDWLDFTLCRPSFRRQNGIFQIPETLTVDKDLLEPIEI